MVWGDRIFSKVMLGYLCLDLRVLSFLEEWGFSWLFRWSLVDEGFWVNIRSWDGSERGRLILGFSYWRGSIFFVRGVCLGINGVGGLIWFLSFSSSRGGLWLDILRSILCGGLIWVVGRCVEWFLRRVRWIIFKRWVSSSGLIKRKGYQ